MLFNISDYKDALLYEDSFKTLKHLQPVKDDEGEFVFSSGRNAVVFKMWDTLEQKHKALKCYTSTTAERLKYVQQVADYLTAVISPYLVKFEFYDDELWVDNGMEEPSYQPVVLMDWVEGKTLGVYIQELVYNNNHQSLLDLAIVFDQLAHWLLQQPFAHGDIKHENILIQKEGNLVLVDYDGCFVPGMEGKAAPELGTPGYQHPKRDVTYFNSNIDNVSLIVISLSLYIIAHRNYIWHEYFDGEKLIFTESELISLNKATVFNLINIDKCLIANKRFNLLKLVLNNMFFLVNYRIFRTATYEIINFKRQSLSKDNLPELIPYRKGKLWGFCNKELKIIIPCKYNTVELFSEGIAGVSEKSEGYFKFPIYDFIDLKGNKINLKTYDSEFFSVESFHEGYVTVKKNGKWGYMNRSGIEVIPIIYDKCNSFYKGKARVMYQGKWGIIDKTGMEIIPFIFDEMEYFVLTNFIKVKKGFKWGYINSAGKEIIPCIYEDCEISINEDFFLLKKYKKWALKIRENNLETIFIYNEIKPYYIKESCLFVVKFDSFYGVIDINGKIVVPYQYLSIIVITDNIFCVLMDGFYLFIDREGVFLLNKKFKHCIKSNIGIWVNFNDTWALINFSLEVVYEIKAEKLVIYNNGLCNIYLSGKWGLIDERKGEMLLPCIYDKQIEIMFNKYYKVCLRNMFGLFDINFKQIFPCIYKEIYWKSNVLFKVQTENGYDFININGQKYWDE
jgi:serine/threonine protein kinase